MGNTTDSTYERVKKRVFSVIPDSIKVKEAYNHSKTTHASPNAQKNSDITKAEIDAKLTGEI